MLSLFVIGETSLGDGGKAHGMDKDPSVLHTVVAAIKSGY